LVNTDLNDQGVGVTGGGFLGVVGSSPGVGVGYAVGLGDAVGVAVGVGVGPALAVRFPFRAAPINPDIASTHAVNKSTLRCFIYASVVGRTLIIDQLAAITVR